MIAHICHQKSLMIGKNINTVFIVATVFDFMKKQPMVMPNLGMNVLCWSCSLMQKDPTSISKDYYSSTVPCNSKQNFILFSVMH